MLQHSYKRVLALGLLGSSFIFAHPVLADNDLDDLRDSGQKADAWQLVKFDSLRNIKLWSKQEDNKRIRSYRIEAVIDAPMEVVARVGFDIDRYPRWYWKLQEARLLKKVSDREYIYYLVHQAPVGNPDRDVILRAVVEPYSKDKGYAAVRIKAVPDYLPHKPPLVRMRAEDMLVKYTPLANGKTLFENEGYIDPGGAAPNWVVNFIQRQAPYAVMVGLQRMVNMPEYREPTLPLPYKLFMD